MHAIRVHTYGGPEQLQFEEIEDPQPQAGEVLVEIAAAGVNFIDVYQRTGAYPGTLPFIPGSEAAGIVRALGADVSDLQVGDLVAYATQPGSYAQAVVVPTSKLVPVPQGVDAQVAAAAMLQGMTAQFLTHSAYPIKAGDYVLVHAAAGGVGALLVQMAKQRGATVFGTVSTPAKAELAKAAGADEVIMYTQTSFVDEVKRLTAGKGVQVVYDSVGKTTFDGSLDCLARRGYMILFGQSSGAVPPFNPQILNSKGSLFLTRPTLFHYIAEREDLLQRAGDIFNMIQPGTLKIRIDRTFPLAQAGDAHRLLESRGSSGKLLLIP
ncbi:MAG: quinone oxidoreductase [Herpetosiphonaceae bacterium]|nr:quinone oxidoreductase [Herpetosiphonaceae bacterium]